MRKLYLTKLEPSQEVDEKKRKKGRNDDDDDFLSLDGPDIELLDPHTPTIYLSGEVNSKMAKKFREAVRVLEFVRKSDLALIVIDSIGGSVLACFEILNVMKASNIDFVTYCISHAYSAGAVILSAGSKGKRFMAPLSNAMVHQISAGAMGHLEEMRTELKYFEKVNAMLVKELCKNCGISQEKFQKMISDTGSTDLHLDPEEAKKMGLVDEVAHVNLIQAKAYQLEVTTEDPEEEPKKSPSKTKKPFKGSPKESQEIKSPAKKPVRKKPTRKGSSSK